MMFIIWSKTFFLQEFIPITNYSFIIQNYNFTFADSFETIKSMANSSLL